MCRVFILKLRSVPGSRKTIEIVPGQDPQFCFSNLHIVRKPPLSMGCINIFSEANRSFGMVVCNVGNDSIFSVVNLEIVHSRSAPAES